MTTRDDHDWYEVIDGSELEQGDLLLDYPIVLATKVATQVVPTLIKQQRDVIILTQTCDMQKVSQQTILLAEVQSYDEACRDGPESIRSRKFREAVVRGLDVANFLLHSRDQDHVEDAPALPWSLVGFRNLSVAMKSEFAEYASAQGPRLRLRSPYKEHLSQAYARFMMRVGLPVPASEFENYVPPQR